MWGRFMHKFIPAFVFLWLSALATLIACSGTHGASDDEYDVFVYGLMTDSRDGQVYKTVKIGSQIWMAENLNYELPESFCHEENPNSCIKYGRLYKWESAMDACPDGWHLPTRAEWDSLISAAGGRSVAGKMLKSTDGWIYNGNGSDDYGFSALPAGLMFQRTGYTKFFNNEGYDAFFWNASEFDRKNAYVAFLHYYSDSVDLAYVPKGHEFAVRCVYGNPPDDSKVSKGTFFDTRDFRTYKTVTIGSQIWMAENLNYETENSSCYDNNPRNCIKYGRLYTWSAAKNACPIGWHLPSEEEWDSLRKTVGEPFDRKLKSTMNWFDYKNGTDDFGFSALPAGYCNSISKNRCGYGGMDRETHFWSSTEKGDKSYAANIMLDYFNSCNYCNPNVQYSVRCVKNEVPTTSSIPKSLSINSSTSTTTSLFSHSSSSVYVQRKLKKSSSSTMLTVNASSSSRYFIFPSTVVRGTLNDSRDGKKYKTVAIGSQIWMAENLNYEMESSSCYHNIDDNCTNYGRLYAWKSAIKACPVGWHLPTQAEWDSLFVAVGGTEIAGQKLKKLGPEGPGYFEYVDEYEDSDDYGFSVLLAGAESGDGEYSYYFDLLKNAYFWSSTEADENHVSRVNFRQNIASVQHGNSFKKYKYSVRCLKDEKLDENRGLTRSHAKAKDKREPVDKGRDSSIVFFENANLFNTIGSMTDSRDGQTYRTVTFGDQTWMAENLNYESEFSYCYHDSLIYCEKFGRLYKWDGAIDACPAGYHLPTKEDWEKLVSSMGGSIVAGKMLKSMSGWNGVCKGTVDYGFSALPVDAKDSTGKFDRTTFWSSSESIHNTSHRVYTLSIFCKDAAYIEEYSMRGKYPVRCLKGELKQEKRKKQREEGFFRDSRDGQIYKSVKIGEQTWMAENLNYKMDSSNCIHNDDVFCTKYGREYTWTAAMKSCPAGYHLPTRAEWETLITTVGGVDSARTLMATTNWDWIFMRSGIVGSDEYGFSALSDGYSVSFWSSTEKGSYYADAMVISCEMESHNWCFAQCSYISDDSKSSPHHVRCIKGEMPQSTSSGKSCCSVDACYSSRMRPRYNRPENLVDLEELIDEE